MATEVVLGATQIVIDYEIREDAATIMVHSDRPLCDTQQLTLLKHVTGDPLATYYNTHHMELHCMLVYRLVDDCHQDMNKLLEQIKRELLAAL